MSELNIQIPDALADDVAALDAMIERHAGVLRANGPTFVNKLRGARDVLHGELARELDARIRLARDAALGLTGNDEPASAQ